MGEVSEYCQVCLLRELQRATRRARVEIGSDRSQVLDDLMFHDRPDAGGFSCASLDSQLGEQRMSPLDRPSVVVIGSAPISVPQ